MQYLSLAKYHTGRGYAIGFKAGFCYLKLYVLFRKLHGIVLEYELLSPVIKHKRRLVDTGKARQSLAHNGFILYCKSGY